MRLWPASNTLDLEWISRALRIRFLDTIAISSITPNALLALRH
jgi:hypothetical protein